MIKTVKVQQSGTNTYLSIPREIRELADIKKGDTVLLTVNEKTKEIIISK